MMERLNFYDLYGYLLPGVALVGTWWLPLWLVAGRMLPAEWSSALVALVVGYIAGHALYRVDRNAFPHKSAETGGREPSDYLLDDSDSGLSTELKAPGRQEERGVAPVPAHPDTARRRFVRRAVPGHVCVDVRKKAGVQ